MPQIVSISYLGPDDTRIRVPASPRGRFPVPVDLPEKTDPFAGTFQLDPEVFDLWSFSRNTISATDFVRHEFIKTHDPTLTLSDGGKVRVYKGGDPKTMTFEAESTLRQCSVIALGW